MRIPMEYKIISGSVVEIKRTWMSARSSAKKTRGTRIAGNSSERKIRQNEIERTKQLASRRGQSEEDLVNSLPAVFWL